MRKRWSTALARRLLVGLVCAGVVLTQSASVLADEPWWWWSHASAYGSESVWDGGYWSDEQWNWTGYYGHRTSFGWNCATPEMRKPDSPYYEWAVMTPDSYGVASRDPALLGTWVEMRIQQPDGSYGPWRLLPVIDAGPFGVWWNWDLMEPVILREGWGAVAPSRYGDRPGPYFGRADVMVRMRPDLGRFCPNWGYHDEPPRG